MQNIVVFTDQPLTAHGISSVVESVNDIEITAFCDNPTSLANLPDAHSADILLLDMAPALTLASLMHLREAIPSSRIVLRQSATATIEFLIQAVDIGVRGILPNKVSAETLLECLRRVGQGELWYDPCVTARVLNAPRVRVTPRESQLVTLVAQGLRNKEIAYRLSISEGTVKVYLSKLFTKLGVEDRYQLALHGLKNLGTVDAPTAEGSLQNQYPKSFGFYKMPVNPEGYIAPRRTPVPGTVAA
jgi:DNA-binding NarL/FixJ family response regulator